MSPVRIRHRSLFQRRYHLKRFAIFLGIILFLVSCAPSRDTYSKCEVVTLKVHITNTYLAKYSKVFGYCIYNNIVLNVSNDISGYYYKKYSLKSGDEIEANVTVYHFQQTDGTFLRTSVDFSKYEIK